MTVKRLPDPSEIPYGEPCPICGPEGHRRHVDDSYGGCVTCMEYVPHTDDDYERVAFPCPASKVPDYKSAVDLLRRWRDAALEGDASDLGSLTDETSTFLGSFGP